MNEVTRILEAVGQGEPRAADRLLPLVYDELRNLAAQRLLQEKPGQTLQATALVHEAYLRLVGPNDGHDGNSRGHFFAAAAEAMRRILVEQARRKHRVRHGDGRHRLSFDHLDLADEQAANDFLDLDEALQRRASEDPSVAAVVQLRYFNGLTSEQTAKALGISLRTAKRHWAYARAYLYQHLSEPTPE